MTDTIFALSSGAPPAAIGIIRISGPAAGLTLERLIGSIPKPRKAVLHSLYDGASGLLDRPLVIWFPGPASSTGEDCVELHCHGGRAVTQAILDTLGEMDGLRPAEAGEFTRRAFTNGRLDLAEAEALADLLTAETEIQRRSAMAGFSGGLSAAVADWRERILALSAEVEAVLDFSDEEDAQGLGPHFFARCREMADDVGDWLQRPSAERLRDGIRVVLAGPPNSGKSSLFNRLLNDDAAIVSDIAGTTRDVIERPISLGGTPMVLVDTAGLREETNDGVESQGIARARAQYERADILLWLGPEGEGPEGAIEVQSRSDVSSASQKKNAEHVVSAVTGLGVDRLINDLISRSSHLLPKPAEAVVNARQRRHLSVMTGALGELPTQGDLVVIAEHLRIARSAIDAITGRTHTEEMLSMLFARFCIGK